MIWTLPEVMMGIDNRQVRIKNWLRRRLGQPGIVRSMDAAESGGLS